LTWGASDIFGLSFSTPESATSLNFQATSFLCYRCPWIAHFPVIIRVCSPKVEHLLTMSSLSGLDGGTNNPFLQEPLSSAFWIFVSRIQRISHQSELSSKSLSFSAVVQNTRRLSLLRKLGDRLDLDIHRYQMNAPISHKLI